MQGGSLPGVLLISPLDGMDAARNLITMLRRTPTNTDVVLVRVGRADPGEWAQNADALQHAAERSMNFLDDPLPKSARVAKAHNEGQSVWTLSRTGKTLEFLSTDTHKSVTTKADTAAPGRVCSGPKRKNR